MSQPATIHALSISLLVIANILFITVVSVTGHDRLHGENAILENFQVLLLTTGGALYLWLSGKVSTADKYLYRGLALLSASFVLRELDLELLPVPALVQSLGSGFGRNLLLTLLWGWLFYAWFNRVADKRRFIFAFLQSRSCLLLTSALLLLIGSALLDRGLVVPGQARLFEELAETNAYLLMLLPALSIVWRMDATQPALQSITYR